MTAKDLVLHATTELFGHRDLSAIDRAWAADYVEHSTLAGPGLLGLRDAAASLPAGFRHDDPPPTRDATGFRRDHRRQSVVRLVRRFERRYRRYMRPGGAVAADVRRTGEACPA